MNNNNSMSYSHYLPAEEYTSRSGRGRALPGFSERTARRLAHNSHRPARTHRDWRTRNDPFAEVWERELVPLLEAEPRLQARTLLEKLQAGHEGRFPDKLLRTLQRKVRRWKAVSGPKKDVIFRAFCKTHSNFRLRQKFA